MRRRQSEAPVVAAALLKTSVVGHADALGAQRGSGMALRSAAPTPVAVVRVAVATLVIAAAVAAVGLGLLPGVTVWLAVLSPGLIVLVSVAFARRQLMLVPAAVIFLLWSLPLALVSLGYESLVDLGSKIGGAASLALVGNVAFAAGALVVMSSRRRRQSIPQVEPHQWRANYRFVLGLSVADLTGTLIFWKSVHGFSYLSNLNDTGSLTAGLTPVIWLMFFARYAGVVLWTRSAGRTASRVGAAVWIVGMATSALVGTRLFLVIGAFELVMAALRHNPRLLSWVGGRVRRARRRKTLLLVVLGVAIGMFVFFLGQYRTNLNVKAQGGTPVPETVKSFFGKYVNNYADAVRTGEAVSQLVPSAVPYNNGASLASALTHPLPQPLRINYLQPSALVFYLGGVNGNGSALPLETEGYIMSGLPGDALFMLMAGAGSGLLAIRWDRQRDGYTDVLALAGIVTVCLFLRGSLAGALAFGGLEIVGFWLAERTIFVRPAQLGPCSPSLEPRRHTPNPSPASR